MSYRDRPTELGSTPEERVHRADELAAYLDCAYRRAAMAERFAGAAVGLALVALIALAVSLVW